MALGSPSGCFEDLVGANLAEVGHVHLRYQDSRIVVVSFYLGLLSHPYFVSGY